jgi:hypothetical protein
MAAGTMYSGKTGTVKRDVAATQTEIPHTQSWKLDVEATESKTGTNSTSGYFERATGTVDVTGEINVIVHDGETAPLVIGTTYDMELHIDDAGTNYYGGDFIVSAQKGLEVEMEDGSKFLKITYTIGCMGAITANGDVPPLPT